MNASESRLFLIRKFQYMRPHHRKKDFYTTSVLRDAKLCNLPDSFGHVKVEKWMAKTC